MEFLKKFSEIKKELFQLEIFKTAINGMILFLASTISLQFFRFFWLYGIFPPIFYFTVKVTSQKGDRKTIEEVSKEYPELEEKLKTAYDNKEMENEIVRDLLEDVSEDSEKMESSRFLNAGKIFQRVALCIALTFVLLSLNFFQFSAYSLGLGYDPAHILKEINSRTGLLEGQLTSMGEEDSGRRERSNYTTEEEKKKIGGEGGGGKIPGFSKGPIPGSGGGAGTKPGEDIQGELSSGEISGEEITMEMHPEYGGEIEIKEERIKSPSEEFSLEEAKGARGPQKDPVKYKEIIKRYFEKLLEEKERH